MNITHGLRRLLLGACTAVALTPGVDLAQTGTATLTVNDSNCASWTVSGSGPNFTLTCQSLNCTIAAAPSLTPLINTQATLTATCNPASGTTTLSWTLVAGSDANCPTTSATTASITLGSASQVATPGGCLYQVSARNAQMGNGQSNATVVWSNTPPPAPSGCTVTANPTTVPQTGGTVNLSASCTGGGAASSYAWTKNGTAMTGTGSTNSDTLGANSGATATVTYAVVASNAGGSAPSTSVGVVWTGAGGGGGGGGGGTYSCTGFTTTLSAPDLTWSGTSPLAVNSSDLGSFGTNTAMVIGVTPTGAGGASNYGRLAIFEYGAQKYNGIATVSTSPCDFNVAPPTLAPAGGSAVNGGPDPALFFTVGGGVQSWWYFDMTGGTKYYINIKNANSNGTSSCPAGANCSIRVELYKPSGM